MNKNSKSDDFASAAMMRLVAAGLARQGIEAHSRPPSGAYVARSGKRSVLEAVAKEYGLGSILRIVDVLPDMPPEPVLQALTKARDTGDLMERWHRLERFSHASHEIVWEQLSESALSLTHRSRNGGKPPNSVETTLVIAVLAKLAEEVSKNPVTLATKAGQIWRRAKQWQDISILDADSTYVLNGLAKPQQVLMSEDIVDDDIVNDLRRLLSSDLIRRWTLSDLAAEVGTSERTLQRRLTANASSFSQLVAEARLQEAARHLCEEHGPGLAEIGFLSGFADQAHFTRAFSKAVGTTPNAYRSDFAG